MKRILKIAFWIAIVAGVSYLFIFANIRQDKLICPKFEIKVIYNEAPVLITQGNIRQEITRNKIKVRGKELGNIEVEKIQELLNQNPFIKTASITTGVNGVVKASVIQRNPLVRVVDMKGTQFYLDEEGYLMPLSPEYPARVIIAGGKIKPIGKIEKYKSNNPDQLQYKKLPSDLQKIYVTAMEIRKEEFSNSLIEQLFLNENGEIEMIPKIGQQSIILGDTSQIKEKLRNLKVFYTDGIKATGWDSYKTINLKYRNQVVCTKTK